MILPYDPKVEVLWSTPNPTHAVCTATSNTMKGILAGEINPSSAVVKFLYQANHGSPLEHAVICFEVTQISRACMDQLRTHRMGSFTASSQHYQDHREYKAYMSSRLSQCNNGPTILHTVVDEYAKAIDNGMPKEEARQFLPMAMEARVIWTVNARSLANFLNLRLCRRNTEEMILLAKTVRHKADMWFPALFGHVSMDCAQEHTKCRQGKMACGRGE